MMKTFKLFSMAALALVMAACSSEDNALENATPAMPGLIPFSATVAPLSGATTRTEYTEVTSGDDAGKINVAWKKGDQIFIARLTPDLGTAGRVTVGEPNDDGSAPLSGNISGDDGNEIKAYYPASAYDDWGIFSGKYIAQDGTLSGIQDNLDYRIGTGKISVIGGKATLADKLQMKSQIAIWKLTLQNTSGANLNATKVTIKNGSDIIAATKDISATSEVHMAVPFNTSPTTFSNLTIEATTAAGTYTYAAPSAVNLSHSTYYQSTVKMATPLTLTGPAVGQVIGSDGKNYAASASLPSGVTKVAMIAYVSGSNGLAIALADEADIMNWKTAKSTCEAKTPAFTGGTWKLPTQEEWNQMFSANGGSDESYAGLNTALAAAGGDGSKLQEVGFYWSSTPKGGAYAWEVGLWDDGANWHYDLVGDPFRVRACLAFGYARGHALASSAVGEIVGSDGLAYYASDKNDLPLGVTAVAMVAYKSETAGESLAIQLNASPASMSWSDACNYSGYPSITGTPGTWRLPSKADWQNMFVGCAKSGDAGVSDDMNPIAGFKEKIGATGITWKSDRYWSSTDSGSVAWSVIVNLDDSPAYASFGEGDTSNPSHVLGCLAF